jgi:para-nitrobenzyl esterase
VPGFSLPEDPTASDEDCLNLNVWTQGLDGERPVLVWLHGGGFTTGTGASALFSGRHLAGRGLVVVTINYRLGALGLLAHPELSSDGDGWGNWFLHDQIAALRWVADNIAAFGGDPGSVTLAGESAGAMSICALLGAPRAAGLFHRAVVQSGPPVSATAHWAQRRAEDLARRLDVAAGDMGGLRNVSAARLVTATQSLATEPAQGGLPLALLPVVDGGILDEPPGDVIAAGRVPAVPLLIGTTRDEAALFTVGESAPGALSEERVVRRVARAVGGAAAEVVDAYRAARHARGEAVTPHDLWTAVTTDYVFRIPSLTMASAHGAYQPKTFAYLFAWESPFMDGRFGSCHGLDIPFVFGTVVDPRIAAFAGGTAAALALSEQMQAAWVAFAVSGDPACEPVGAWSTYDAARRPTMVFSRQTTLEEDPRQPERLVWEQAGHPVGIGHHHE